MKKGPLIGGPSFFLSISVLAFSGLIIGKFFWGAYRAWQ
jgi:hypothetical protein